MKDEINPLMMFQTTSTLLLTQIVQGDVDAVKLAMKELANRGLDVTGKYIGFAAK